MNKPTTTPPEATFRQRSADRLVDYPFLSLLALNPALLVILAVLLGGALAFAIALPKIWVTTPPGFRPEVRISLLDKVQAWSLRRSAVKLAAAGDAEQASRTWASAIGNNLGDPEPIRDFLRHVATTRNPSTTTISQCLNQAQWLLSLTGTNRTDAGLVALTCDRLALYGPVVELLEPHQANLSPAEEAAFQKALFFTGRIDEFGKRVAGSTRAASPDPELALCRAAYTAGWGPPEATSAARDEVARAEQDFTLGVMATRLRLMLCVKLIDPEGYAQALQRLQGQAADRIGEHIRYWQLLNAVGRANDARREAVAYRATPRSANEVVQLIQALQALGMQEHALKILQSCAPLYGQEKGIGGIHVWMTYADLLIENRAWDDLLGAAVQMRASPRHGRDLAGSSYYLEGRALIGKGRMEEASTAFERAAESPFPTPEAGLEATELMLRSGQVAPAMKLLRQLEPSLKESARYWQWVFEAAIAERSDHVLFLHAAREAYCWTGVILVRTPPNAYSAVGCEKANS